MGKPSVRTRIAGSRRRQVRQLIISAAIVFVFCWVLFPSISYLPSYSTPQPRVEIPDEIRNTLFLDEDQCTASFPGLFDSIDVQVAKGPFELGRAGSYATGRIKDGKIYILEAEKAGDMSDMMLRERQAAFHQLSRALLTAPNPIPDTHFALNIRDNPVSASLSYSRSAGPEFPSETLHNVFLMPHFAYWHWPRLPFISSLPNATHTISALESSTPFSAKIPKAVWRGTPWFASVNNIDLRKKLIAVSQNPETKEQYPWADIEQLKWQTNGKTAENALNIEDFCKYKYIVYTEGVTYSGRLQFHQLCESVLITPPIAWLQHTTHLMKPVWSTELLGSDPSWQLPSSGIGGGKEKGTNGRSAAHPSENSRKMWPESKTYPPEEANAVFVAPDWSDLEEIIGFLEAHPNLASGIARRQRETFHGGGYFSPAAEVCYWRALIRGWSAVAQVPKGGKENDERVEGSGKETDVGFWDQEGTPFELWVLDETIKPQTPHR